MLHNITVLLPDNACLSIILHDTLAITINICN